MSFFRKFNPNYAIGGAFLLRTSCISWGNPDSRTERSRGVENHFFSAA